MRPLLRPSSLKIILLAPLILSPLATHAQPIENPTPLILAVHDAPVPFTGSDHRTHLVYELWMMNFSSGDIAVQKVEIFGDGKPIDTLDSATIATRLQPAGLRESTGTLARSTQALLFIHITLPNGISVPKQITHRVTTYIAAAPPAFQYLTSTGGGATASGQTVTIIHPPLAGDRYISADSCCDATRHTRAAIGVNGRVWLAQRYAVDWEQIDANGHIYSGPRENLASYTIFGKPALAVADATVVSVTDKLPEQTPGKYPSDIALQDADGNSVILDLGNHQYALYAHLQPDSIRVHPGDNVKPGQIIGLVGNSGNSVAPHLHFQLMSETSSLASNGLPYEIDSFQITGQTPGTKAFDEAEEKGTPLAIRAMSPAQSIERGLPLDQLIISFHSR